ncbi:MAG: putative lipid II flippase FtsW [Succinivibrio sp.]|nr:putative lipid II flippase FtsW [Succinivibrio sp.]
MGFKLASGSTPGYDRFLLLVTVFLLIISVVLISSASVMEATLRYGNSSYLMVKQLEAIIAALLAATVAAAVPSAVWKAGSVYLMLVVLVLLIVVLIVGREINEAKRWISLGVFNLQPAELLKLFWILYFSSYVSRKGREVRHTVKGFLKPMGFIAAMALLLLLQPDFGSLVVVTAITFAILWVGGSRLIFYILTLAVTCVMGAILVITQPYRMRRVLSFLDPWEDQFGSGYQLTQSLMAFGRGGLSGEGLGNSLQKLGYLPEAHTDFITSILGEEFGFIGMCVVIALEFIIVCKAVRLGIRILRQEPVFEGYAAFGIGVWFCLQTFINIGAASGALPTKGLTLPLVSYGGSSMLVSCVAVAVLLRLDYEQRQKHALWGGIKDGAGR